MVGVMCEEKVVVVRQLRPGWEACARRAPVEGVVLRSPERTEGLGVLVYMYSN